MQADAAESFPHRCTASLPDLKKHWLLQRQTCRHGIVWNTLVCIRTWLIWSQFFWGRQAGSQGSTASPGYCFTASKTLLRSFKSLLMAQPRSPRLPRFKVQMERGKNISRWQTENYVLSSSWLEVRIRSLVTSFFTALHAIEPSCCSCGIVNIADLYQ